MRTSQRCATWARQHRHTQRAERIKKKKQKYNISQCQCDGILPTTTTAKSCQLASVFVKEKRRIGWNVCVKRKTERECVRKNEIYELNEYKDGDSLKRNRPNSNRRIVTSLVIPLSSYFWCQLHANVNNRWQMVLRRNILIHIHTI